MVEHSSREESVVVKVRPEQLSCNWVVLHRLMCCGLVDLLSLIIIVYTLYQFCSY